MVKPPLKYGSGCHCTLELLLVKKIKPSKSMVKIRPSNAYTIVKSKIRTSNLLGEGICQLPLNYVNFGYQTFNFED